MTRNATAEFELDEQFVITDEMDAEVQQLLADLDNGLTW